MFWYKADPNVNYKMCSQELWHMQAIHDENEALGAVEKPDDEERYNPLLVKKNKNAPVINVRKAY